MSDSEHDAIILDPLVSLTKLVQVILESELVIWHEQVSLFSNSDVADPNGNIDVDVDVLVELLHAIDFLVYAPHNLFLILGLNQGCLVHDINLAEPIGLLNQRSDLPAHDLRVPVILQVAHLFFQLDDELNCSLVRKAFHTFI